ncbi:MAG: FtsW/RodA/SpoVE family cell cycle protein [Oscillospiraceae bacterium]|nr:FtsW/RodA/SpoVE family cell cycle protein [Oscillospiraceae bacterium]
METVKSGFKLILKFLRDADMVLFTVGLISAIYGILLISSVAGIPGASNVSVQIGSLLIGIFLFIIFSYIDIDIIAGKSWVLYIISIFFMLTLIIWGEEQYDNTAWLRFWGIGIQPSEVVKVTFTIIMARTLANYKEKKTLNSIVSLLQILLVFGSMFIIVVWTSGDIGSSMIFIFILVVMLFIAGVKLRWFILGAAGIVALLPLFLDLLARYRDGKLLVRILAPYRGLYEYYIYDVYSDVISRVEWKDAIDQANRSLGAITNGEFLGQGLGKGEFTQKPANAGGIWAQESDFIFSAAGEEMGFVGALLVIALLTTIIIRCVYVGVKSNNALGLLVCMGLATIFIAQTIVHIGMCLGILPVIGLTLPFFSYGGSSLVSSFAALGIVSGIKMRPKPIRFRYL